MTLDSADDSDSNRIDDLLDQWEDALDAGEELSADALCAEQPHLLPELEKKIAILRRMNATFAEETPVTENSGSESLSVHSDISNLVFHAKGGLGAVYRAKERGLNREVAVKFIHHNLVHNDESRQRFELEAEVTGRLEHPGVVPLYGMGKDANDRLFYYMRYIDGETLNDAIARFHQSAGRRLDVHSVEFKRLLTSFISVCRTIAYAHNRGIVHRDIKPTNVMLGRYGETIVVDWGLAVPVERDDRFRLSGEATLMPTTDSNSGNSSGSGVGTPAYMSSEQMSGIAPTPASDIYSLGATLYKILTGRPPFASDDAIKLREQVLNGAFPNPGAVRSGVSKGLQAVCLKAMASRPSDRYQTALDLADDIENHLADAPVSARQDGVMATIARWFRRNRTAAQSIALATTAILVISSVSALRQRSLATQADFERQRSESARVTAEQARTENLSLGATFLARAVGDEIDRRFRLMEAEVRSDALRTMLADSNAHPGERQYWQPIQSWLNDRESLNREAVKNASWCVYDARGYQIARSPRGQSIGVDYRHRDYFHGFGGDLPKTDPRLKGIQPFEFLLPKLGTHGAVHRSVVFESTNTNTLFVSFSTPVWDKPPEADERKPIGLFGIPLEINDFSLFQNALMFQLDNDSFRGKPGMVIWHPQLPKCSEESLPPLVSAEIVARAKELRAGPNTSLRHGLIDSFRDPITGIESTAAMAPVFVSGRPDVISDTGWIVVVTEQAPQE